MLTGRSLVHSVNGLVEFATLLWRQEIVSRHLKTTAGQRVKLPFTTRGNR